MFAEMKSLSNDAWSKIYDRELSIRVLNALLRKAGADTTKVHLIPYTERDEWADYRGVKVVCDDIALTARTLVYLEQLLERRAARVRQVSGGREHMSIRVSRASRDVCALVFLRTSIGD